MGETGIDDFEINFNTLKDLATCIPVYHTGQDTFFIRPEKPLPATSFDWDGELWLRVNAQTGDIVGLEIDNFESVFLKKHPEVAKVWKEAKSHCIHKKIEMRDDDICESFLRMILEFLSDIFQNVPQQARFSAI
jgi:hypothetical protein